MFALNLILINIFLSFYLLCALQWYSYRFLRIVFHYHKLSWHMYFFIFPLLVYLLNHFYGKPSYFLLFCIFIYFPLVYYWDKRLDKRLVFTARIKAYLIMLSLYLTIFIIAILKYSFFYIGIEPLILALFSSFLYEHFKLCFYIKAAKDKINSMPKLQIILITASFGKTSMKNYLFGLLSPNIKTQASQKSVNTLVGIVRDINENLEEDTKIYIAEAGARQGGDILELCAFLNPQYVIIGQIGKAHLEYFKSEENIRNTKLEALNSTRLKTALCHSSTKLQGYDFYDEALSCVNSKLDALSFKLELSGKIHSFKVPLLGDFNAENLAACIQMAQILGIDLKDIKANLAKLKPVAHRLQLLCKHPKIVIDDSFNGNLIGMRASYKLCSSYKGRKVIITPGILEVSDEENIELAKLINKSFDFAILTGSKNASLIASYLDIEHFILKDKSLLTKELARLTKAGDLVLFSNDSPSYL